jgi:hypothetical protein
MIIPNMGFQTLFLEVPFNIRVLKYCNSEENNPAWPSGTFETYIMRYQNMPVFVDEAYLTEKCCTVLFPNYEVDLSFLVRNLRYQMKVLDWNHPVRKHDKHAYFKTKCLSDVHTVWNPAKDTCIEIIMFLWATVS